MSKYCTICEAATDTPPFCAKCRQVPLLISVFTEGQARRIENEKVPK